MAMGRAEGGGGGVRGRGGGGERDGVYARRATREKNARAKKKRFFGFAGGAKRAPEGEIMIAGVIEPFAFEGRRKQARVR